MPDEAYVTIPLKEFERLKQIENSHHAYLGLRPGQVCPICAKAHNAP